MKPGTPKIPPRPKGLTPCVVTCAVQDLLYVAFYKAETSLIEATFGPEYTNGMAWVWASARLSERMKSDISVKIEFYKLITFFINESTPPEPSHKGVPVDRFEARQRAWDQLFGA